MKAMSEYNTLSKKDKSALGYVRNNYKDQILNFKGFEDEIISEDGEDILRPSDIDVYLSSPPQEQSLIINNIKDCDESIEKKYQEGLQVSEKYINNAKFTRVKKTAIVFNNKDVKNGNIDELTPEQQDYFLNELNNSGTLVTVKYKKHGKYYNKFVLNGDWFDTLSAIPEAKNFSQCSLGFGTDERWGVAVDVDDPIYKNNPKESAEHAMNVLRMSLDDWTIEFSILSINTEKNTYQMVFLFPEPVEFINKNGLSAEDIKEVYKWVALYIASCFAGADPGYSRCMVKCPLYTNHHIHLDSAYKDINKRSFGRKPYIKKKKFEYWVNSIFNTCKKEGLSIPLSVYRFLGIEEEYTPVDVQNIKNYQKKIENNENLTDEDKKNLRSYTDSMFYTKGNYITLSWQGNISSHPYFSKIKDNILSITKLIPISYEEMMDRFLSNTKYPIECMKYFNEGKVVRNTPSFIVSGYLQRELHKDSLLSLDDSIIGIQVREALMRAYEWYFIGFSKYYSNIEDLSDIHSSAVSGWASTSDFSRYEIEDQIKEHGNSLSYYSWNKGIRFSSKGSKYTPEQRIQGNKTLQFYSNLKRVDTKLELLNKKFTEVKGSPRYKSSVKKENTNKLIRDIFLYEGNEFIYNFSNRKNNEYIKKKLYNLYINMGKIKELARRENIDISKYEMYFVILENLFKELKTEVSEVSQISYTTDNFSHLDKIHLFKNKNCLELDENNDLVGTDFYKEYIYTALNSYSLELKDILAYKNTIDKFKQDLMVA